MTGGENQQSVFCSVECVMTWLLFGGEKPCLLCKRRIHFEDR